MIITLYVDIEEFLHEIVCLIKVSVNKKCLLVLFVSRLGDVYWDSRGHLRDAGL